MLWKFTPANAPWQNGCSEALIKTCKKGITYAVGCNILSLSEFQTVLFEIANVTNERPIGRHPTDPADGAYLWPNNIQLGSATTRAPSGSFNESVYMRQRFELVQLIADCFWKKMTKDFFPSLIIRGKWRVQRRNAMVGYIVIVQDANVAIVTKVFPDNNGVVRRCEVQYKWGNKFTTISRPVQRLVVLVPIDEKDDLEFAWGLFYL